MSLLSFKILSDENIQPALVKFIRDKNCNILDVKEAALNGSSDMAIMELAYKEERLILTHDSDFGRLVATANTPFFGIIYIRPGHINPSLSMQAFDTILKADFPLKPPFIIVAENTGPTVNLRYRQY
ncbi:MAG: DUF5615 family PIN-like protein [Bacteroidia bacterium]